MRTQRRWTSAFALDLGSLTWRELPSTVASRSGHSAAQLDPRGKAVAVWGGRNTSEVDTVSALALRLPSAPRMEVAPQGRGLRGLDPIKGGGCEDKDVVGRAVRVGGAHAGGEEREGRMVREAVRCGCRIEAPPARSHQCGWALPGGLLVHGGQLHSLGISIGANVDCGVFCMHVRGDAYSWE